TGIPVAGAHARSRLDPFAIGAGPPVLEALFGVGHGVERPRRFIATAPAFAGFALGLAFLDAGAVWQQIFEQARRGLGHPHRPAPTLGVELWQQPRMVDMGVGEEEEVDGPGVERGGLEVKVPDALIALEETAIDEELPLWVDDAIA